MFFVNNFFVANRAILHIVIIALLVLFCQEKVYSSDQWDTTDPAGSESPSNLDSLITTNNDVVDRLLADFRQGAKISYISATTLSISSGQVTCDNSARTSRKWRENTSATSVTFSSIDTSTEAASTTYYVYAVADTDVATFTIVISKSATEPSGATYYAKLGQFYNDSSSNIVNDDTLINDNDYNTHRDFGSWISKSNDTSYLASTDGFVMAYNITKYTVKAYTDGSNPPTTLRASERDQGDDADDSDGSITMPVKKGDYYKVTGADSIYWIPLE